MENSEMRQACVAAAGILVVALTVALPVSAQKPVQTPAQPPAQAATQAPAPPGAQPTPKPPSPPFTPAWEALIGEWTGEGSGQPGAGEGVFSFRLELDGKILVRRNRNELAPAANQPAAAHEDLMVVYPIERPGEWRALFADNEGHVINYRARWTADGKRLTFLSDINTGQPRFKLTYRVVSVDQLEIGFEIAAPGSPDTFKPYLSGKARRAKTP
jgi:hypothetical protein